MRPVRVQVARLISSRYEESTREAEAARPESWDDRRNGIDVVELTSGTSVRLFSSAMQSPPKPGWVLMLTDGTETEGYRWTLYGLSPSH